MMLCKISLANIKKSIKDYAIYFFTLILGVVIFYVFNAIDSQTVMLDVTESKREIVRLMVDAISYVSVFVSFILGGLIIYASRFLIKRRNKEFGIYLTLGMSKRKVSIILFFETLLIGIMSLAVGLAIGVLASQLMSIIVANMFEANMTKFKFVFSETAFFKTLLYFSIIYLIVILFNTFQVSRCKLINLLNGSKRGEKLKLKNPWICTIVFIVACYFLYTAYDKVAFHFDIMYLMGKGNFLKILITGCICTLLIFWSLSGLLLKVFSKIKRVYYKGLNAFTLRQFSSNINTMVVSMTIICLMLFLTISMLSSSFSISNTLNDNVKKYTPVDAAVYVRNKEDEDGKIVKENLEEILKTEYDMSKVKDVTLVNYYEVDNLTLKETLTGLPDSYTKELEESSMRLEEQIITISQYNKLAKLYNEQTFELKDNEYIVIVDVDNLKEYRDNTLKANKSINIDGNVLVPKYDKCQEGFVEMEAAATNSGMYIVPDHVVTNLVSTSSYLTFNYNTDDDETKKLYSLEIDDVFKDRGDYALTFDRLEIRDACVGLGALVTFLGLYIGVIFLISCAAILSLKELSESTDNIERYAVLRKIGADERIINRALFRQIFIFFMFPMALAILHSYVGLKFASILIVNFGSMANPKGLFTAASVIVGIYGAYFLITYFGSKSIIKERR